MLFLAQYLPPMLGATSGLLSYFKILGQIINENRSNLKMLDFFFCLSSSSPFLLFQVGRYPGKGNLPSASRNSSIFHENDYYVLKYSWFPDSSFALLLCWSSCWSWELTVVHKSFGGSRPHSCTDQSIGHARHHRSAPGQRGRECPRKPAKVHFLNWGNFLALN